MAYSAPSESSPYSLYGLRLSLKRTLISKQAFDRRGVPLESWHSHDTGMVALLSARGVPGPGLARSIYREARYSTVGALHYTLQFLIQLLDTLEFSDPRCRFPGP